QDRGAVLLDHSLRLGGGDRRVDRILGHHLDLAAHDAARGVDLLLGLADAEQRIAAQRAEKAGERRQMADLDDLRSGAEDGGKTQGERARQRGTSLQNVPSSPRRHDLLSPPWTIRGASRRSSASRLARLAMAGESLTIWERFSSLERHA